MSCDRETTHFVHWKTEASVGLALPSPLPIGQERLGQGQTIQDGGGGQHYNPHIQANRLVRMKDSMCFGITPVVIQHIL